MSIDEITLEEELSLVASARQGDNTSTKILLEKYIPIGKRIVGKQLKRDVSKDTEIEGLVIEEIWESITRHNKEYRLGALLGIRLQHRFFDDWKRQKRFVSLDEEAFDDSPVTFIDSLDRSEIADHSNISEDVSPDEEITSHSEQQYLRYLVKHSPLSDQQRAIIELRILGKTQEEISDILKIPQGTVKSSYFRAQQYLNHSRKTPSNIDAYLKGEIEAPFKGKSGRERLAIQRQIFQKIRNDLGIPIEKMTVKLLERYSLNIFETGGKKRTKEESINRLLPTNARVPEFTIFKSRGKWDNEKNTKEALEYFIMKDHGYLIDSKNYFDVFWLGSFIRNKFDNKYTQANEFIADEVFELDPSQKRTYEVLAHITDNDPSLFGGYFTQARDKVESHLARAQKIISNTTITGVKEQDFLLWMQGQTEEAIANKVNRSVHQTSINIREAQNLVKIQAIRENQGVYEKGANVERIKQETVDMITRGNAQIIDRFFRIRFAGLLEKDIEGHPFEQMLVLLRRNDSRLRHYYELFSSLEDALDFVYPGVFPEILFPSKGKWTGANARENAFKALDYVFGREPQRFCMNSATLNKYKLGNATKPYDGAIRTLNEDYFEHHYRQNPLFKEPGMYQTYLANRKFLSILFDPGKSKTTLEGVTINDKKILKLNREEIYKRANITGKEKKAWEARIQLWDYDNKNLKHVEVATASGLSHYNIRINFTTQQQALANAIRRII